MSFITAAAIGAGGSIIGGLFSASAAKSAANANLQAAQQTNALNEKLFNQSRGAVGADGYGHSLLPMYFGGNEQDLGQAAYNNFQRLNSSGENSYNALLGYQSNLRPAFDSSLAALSGRYNGQDLSQRIGFSNPYFNARTNQAGVYGQGYRDVAGANVSGLNTGLAQTLAGLNASRAGQGFVGNSTFDRNRVLSAMLGARQQAAVQTAQANAQANNLGADANLANAGDLRALQFADMDFRSNPSALGAGLGAAGQFEGMPANFSADSFNTALSPLNFFRMQPQAFQAQNMPMQEPGVNAGQILGSALSQGANSYLNYNMSQQLLNKFSNPYSTGLNPYTSAASNNVTGLTNGYNFAPSASFLNYAAPSSEFNNSIAPVNTSLYAPRG